MGVVLVPLHLHFSKESDFHSLVILSLAMADYYYKIFSFSTIKMPLVTVSSKIKQADHSQ